MRLNARTIVLLAKRISSNANSSDHELRSVMPVLRRKLPQNTILMLDPVDRRGFLRKSLLAASASTIAASFEEQNLLARAAEPSSAPPVPMAKAAFPAGKIGKVSISRLICGGNLIS